jgi:hypothetical protein
MTGKAANKRVEKMSLLDAYSRKQTTTILRFLAPMALLIWACNQSWAGQPPFGEKAKKAEEIADPVRLDLKLEGKGGKKQLVITLTNTSKETIVVDRELVFLVHIRAVNDEGRAGGPVDDARDVSETDWTLEKWRNRIITLDPGKTISRRVDLFGEIKSFYYGWTFPGHVPIPGHETIARFDDVSRRVAITVTYSATNVEVRALGEYVGLPREAERLCKAWAFCGVDLRTGKTFRRNRPREPFP